MADRWQQILDLEKKLEEVNIEAERFSARNMIILELKLARKNLATIIQQKYPKVPMAFIRNGLLRRSTPPAFDWSVSLHTRPHTVFYRWNGKMIRRVLLQEHMHLLGAGTHPYFDWSSNVDKFDNANETEVTVVDGGQSSRRDEPWQDFLHIVYAKPVEGTVMEDVEYEKDFSPS